MEENSWQQQDKPVGSTGAEGASPEIRQKSILLRHLLQNIRTPIGLLGLPETQVDTIKALQKEVHLFHTVSVLRPGQETSLPYVLGFLFHLLAISEQEVAGSEPEQLLKHHLNMLGRKSQLILLIIDSANELEPQQRQQLIELAERHSQLRLLLILDAPKSKACGNNDLCLFSLSGPNKTPSRETSLLPLEAENRAFKIVGGAIAILLAALTVTISFLPTEATQPEKIDEALPKLVEPQPDNGIVDGSVAPGEDFLPEKPEEIKLVEKSDPVALVPPIEITTIQPEQAIRNELTKPSLPQIQKPLPELKRVEPEVPVPVKLEVIEATKAIELPKKITPEIKPSEAAPEQEQIEAAATPPPVSIIEDKKTTIAIHQEKWLLSQKMEMFTLQIMGGSDGASITHYIETQKDKEPFAYYRVVKKGKDWYPLLYGIYPSKESAKEAIKKLPRALQKLKPWARSLETIQLEIRDAASPAASD